MSIKICALASGSKGNSLLVTNDRQQILIDAGLRLSELTLRLQAAGAKLTDITAVLSTHCHNDHTKGLRALCEGYDIPVYTHPLGICALEEYTNVDKELIRPITECTKIGDFLVTPIPVSHDVPSCTGFCVQSEGHSFAYFTDLGCTNEKVLCCIRESELLFLESNHDEELLKKGKYPYLLKRRILSEKGHLSNSIAAETVLFGVNYGVRRVMLGHLSEENNLPELAFYTTYSKLQEAGWQEGRQYSLDVAMQDSISKWI